MLTMTNAQAQMDVNKLIQHHHHNTQWHKNTQRCNFTANVQHLCDAIQLSLKCCVLTAN